MIRVGFFREFKGSDSVLIDVDRESLAALDSMLRRLTSDSRTLEITAEPDVIGYGGIVLLAEASDVSGLVTEPKTGLVRWAGTPSYWSDVAVKIAALQDAKAGHQYLQESAAMQVVVSVGEYGPEWWALHGTASRT